MPEPTPFRVLASRTVVLPEANIDTDQIIPARFLTTTSKAGLGRKLFNDWRYGPDGQPDPGFILNTIDPVTHRVLVAGPNFGCGSSREHAPWALTDYGFRAVVSTSIADIFTSNALKNGLLPVSVDDATHARLLSEPGQQVAIDLESCELRLADGHSFTFTVEPFARRCLLDGVDTLGWLLNQTPRIEAFEQRRAA
jgi:3-isopropylmalate/(R)-2-methylmalate dehydratase small subunit